MLASWIELFRTLTGQIANSEFAQDWYGFRALIFHLNPYLSQGDHTTHPPVAFLLAAPVGLLPRSLAFALWGWLMLGAVLLSLHLYGLSWKRTLLLLPLLSVWPPFVFGLSQITPLWLLGSALAFHYRDRPFIAGLWIAFASLTKFFPAILLLPFLRRRQWSALAGFSLVWAFALSMVAILQPSVFSAYLRVNSVNGPDIMLRLSNGAFLPSAYKALGWIGVGLASILLFLVSLRWKDWHTCEYLSVALLPIAWSYSLLPLLGLLTRKLNPFLVYGLILSFVFPGFGLGSGVFVPLSIFFFGLSLVYTPMRRYFVSLARTSSSLWSGSRSRYTSG